jgi:hypothetical protein
MAKSVLQCRLQLSRDADPLHQQRLPHRWEKHIGNADGAGATGGAGVAGDAQPGRVALKHLVHYARPQAGDQSSRRILHGKAEGTRAAAYTTLDTRFELLSLGNRRDAVKERLSQRIPSFS